MILYVFLCYFIVSVTSKEKTKMYMRTAKMQDQASASSGYAYRSDSNGPTSYVHFSGGSGGYENFGYPPIAIAHYSQEYPYTYFPHHEYSHYTYDPSDHSLSDLHDERTGLDGLSDKLTYGYGHGKEIDYNDFVKEGGKDYDDSKYSIKGEKGQSGYENKDLHEKGSKGEHDKEAHKGYYDKKGGDKEGHEEVSEHYGSKNEASKGSKGASYSESSGHKKGSKTTGFHKTYHKDEFKKDHTFYDESDESGHFNKYDTSDQHHAVENGGFVRGGHLNSGFQEKNQGEKGVYDKGHYDVKDSKFNGEEGGTKYYGDRSEFANKASKEIGKSFGYKGGEDSYY